jgi:integrase
MLTDLAIRQIKSRGSQQEQAVGGVAGLTIRINQAGRKTFFLAFRAPATGKAARMRLGEYNSKHFSLERARELGRFYRSLIDQGVDPRDYLRAEAERRTREEEEAQRADSQRKASTFSVVVEDYVGKFQVAKKQNRTWKETQRRLMVDCAAWLHRPIAEITRRDIHDLLDRIMADGKGYSANRTYAALKTLFRWCVSRDLIFIDPMQGVERPFDGETERDRAWTDEEVARIWRAADTIGGSAGAGLKVLMLMGQRRDEVFQMQLSELESDGTRWRLTTARSKAKREHVFPLPVLAQRIVRAQLVQSRCEYVFPTSGGKPIVNWTALKERVRRLSGVEDFTFHCARHTLRTGLDRFGVPPHVKDECLNHARQGVGARHYSHYDYINEQRAAFEQWAMHVEELVFGRNVSSLCG